MKKLLLGLCIAFLLSSPVAAEEDFDLVYPFEGGCARVVRELKWGMLDEELKQVVPFEWDYIGELSEGRRIVKKGNLYGFINERHQTVIEPIYAQVSGFSEGLACVKNEEGLWGFVDLSGELVIPFTFEEANDFSCGRALVKTDGLYGYIDTAGTLVIPATLEEAYSFFDDRACVRMGERYGYLNPAGEMAIPATYELAFDFCEGGAVVNDGSYGLIGTRGEWLIRPTWKWLSPALEGGYLKGEKNGATVFVDASGMVCSDGYLDLGDFSEDFVPAKSEEGYGYLDAGFRQVLSPKWDSAGAFSGGFAPVSKEGQFGYIDAKGNLVTALVYKDAIPVSAGYGAVQNQEGKWNFIKVEPFVSDFQETTSRSLLLCIGQKSMKHGTEEIPLDAPPILHEGVTMLPIRQVVEAIGGTVEWNGDRQEISLRYEGVVVTMNLGQAGAFVNGRVSVLEQPPMLSGGRTLVPLRFATESLGCSVLWEPETQEILITYGDQG